MLEGYRSLGLGDLSPDGRVVAVLPHGTEAVELWDTSDASRSGVLQGHTQLISSTSFSPDSRMLASSSWDGTVRLWDVAECREMQQWSVGRVRRVKSVCFSSDARYVAATSETIDGYSTEVHIWNRGVQGNLVKQFEANQVKFSPDRCG